MINYKKNPRLDVFKSELVEGACFSQNLELPLLRRADFKPLKAIPFDKSIKTKEYKQWV